MIFFMIIIFSSVSIFLSLYGPKVSIALGLYASTKDNDLLRPEFWGGLSMWILPIGFTLYAAVYIFNISIIPEVLVNSPLKVPEWYYIITSLFVLFLSIVATPD
jgi:hypothetical protein